LTLTVYARIPGRMPGISQVPVPGPGRSVRTPVSRVARYAHLAVRGPLAAAWAPAVVPRAGAAALRIGRVTRGRVTRRPRAVCGARCYRRMLTARAMTRTTVTIDTADCSSMAVFAHRDSGMTSVGLNAAALVNDRYR